ncbi:MAG: hypothetical protein WDO18_00065 [Acidobacteriota bacterium]
MAGIQRIPYNYQAPSRTQQTNRPAAAQQPTGSARVRSQTDSSSLKLTLRTDEGDTVEISIEALRQRTTGRANASGPNGGTARTKSASDSLTASVSVKGDLSDQEIEDIQKLLRALSSGQAPQDVADSSLDSYDFRYQRSSQVARAQIQAYA